MEFIDLKSQQALIREQLDKRISDVLSHGQYIMGPEVRELEQRLAVYTGSKHCVSASSGTDTLLIALMALGVEADDEVITVPYTWISTAEVIALLGAKPVFIDIEETTWNMDPSLLEAAITPKTKAIMPVGIYGQTADMTAINEIAARHGLPVIEDAAQSFGATHHGKKSGSLSTIGSTSFFPSKPLGGYGDGGALFTDDDELAKKMSQIRVHGQEKKHHHPILGLNGRLDTLQAAIILAKLDIFDSEIVKRQQVAARYSESLKNSSLNVTVPRVANGNTSVWAQYTILSPERDAFAQRLKDKGIPSVSYYSVPLHLQPVFAHLGHKPGDFPVAEKVAEQGISLPMNPYLKEEEIELVCSALSA
ncbi:MAG: DegT/DnrJ/EryC1/StrS family aminotransferase [Luteolibacter sp.]